MHPTLDQTRELLAVELAGCSTEQIAHHPAGDPARWNAQQVIEHLSASWRLTINGIEDRLRKNRPLLTRPSLAQRVGQIAICECGFFPPGRKAPPAVEPSLEATAAPASGDELIARISATLAAMDRTLNRIEPEAKGAPVLTHFILGPLNADRWRKFHRTHARHHVKQIRSAREV